MRSSGQPPPGGTTAPRGKQPKSKLAIPADAPRATLSLPAPSVGPQGNGSDPGDGKVARNLPNHSAKAKIAVNKTKGTLSLPPESIEPQAGNTARATLSLAPDLSPPLAPPNTPETRRPNVLQAGKELPERIGRFLIRELLGEGAFGVVYRAYDPQLDREVALKVAKPGTLKTAKHVERFLREAKSAARLRDPNIVPLFETGRDQDCYYIASAFIKGRTLEGEIEEQPPDFRRAAEIIRTLSEALSYAHSLGVVHRDIKPANVMIDEDGHPLVMDFGLAARMDEAEKLTQAGAILGTPLYIAPEQARGAGGDAVAASDQYSLGVMLYEMVAGLTPFSGPPELLVFHHIKTQPPSPRKFNPKVPRDLETICLKCLEKKPNLRYKDCQGLADDLSRWLEGRPITARRISRGERVVRWCKREPWLAGAMASVVAALLAVASLFAVNEWRKGQFATREVKLKEETEQAEAEAVMRKARSLLGPLGQETAGKGQTVVPLNEVEVEALWELAESPGELLRQRFIEEGLSDRLFTRQLKNRAAFALHAVVGLDPVRRQSVEKMLIEKMRKLEGDQDSRIQLALMVSRLGGLSPEAASAISQTLLETTPSSTNVIELLEYAEGLAGVAPFMQRKEASSATFKLASHLATFKPASNDDFKTLREIACYLPTVAQRADPSDTSAVLAEALAKFRYGEAQSALTRGLVAVAYRLEPGDGIALLSRVIAEIRDPIIERELAPALEKLMTRLGAEETMAVFAKALTTNKTTGVGFLSDELVRIWAAAFGRLEPKKFAAVLTQLQAVAKGPNAPGLLASVLVAMADRMEPEKATTVLLEALAVGKSDFNASSELAKGLGKVVSRMGPEKAVALLADALPKTPQMNTRPELARILKTAASRLDWKEPTRARATAAAHLARALAITGDQQVRVELERAFAAGVRLEATVALEVANAFVVSITDPKLPWFSVEEMARGLVAVAFHLKPEDVTGLCRRAASSLANSISRADAVAKAKALAVLAERLQPNEAARLCARAASFLADELAKTVAKNVNAWQHLAQALAAVAPQLEAKDAAEVVDKLAAAMEQTENTSAIGSLSQALGAVAGRLEPKKAAQVCARAALPIAKTLSISMNVSTLRNLAPGLTALAAHLEAQEAKEIVTRLARARSQSRDPIALAELARAREAVALRAGAKETGDVLTQKLTGTGDKTPRLKVAKDLTVAAAKLEAKNAVIALARAMAVGGADDVLRELARGLEVALTRLKPMEAKEIAGPFIGILAESKQPSAVVELARGVKGLASCLPQEEKSAVCTEAVAAVAQAMVKNRFNPFLLPALGKALATLTPLLGHKEAKEVATGFLRAITDPQVNAQANFGRQQSLPELAAGLAAILAQMSTDDQAALLGEVLAIKDQNTQNALVLGLAGSDLKRVAAVLAKLTAKRGDANAFRTLTGELIVRLSHTASGLKPEMEIRDCGQVASSVAEAMANSAEDLVTLQSLGAVLAILVPRLGPKEAQEVGTHLARGMIEVQAKTLATNSTALSALSMLAHALTGVSTRLGPTEGAAVAALLTEGLAKTKDPSARGALAQALAAAVARQGPKEAAARLTQALASTNGPFASLPVRAALIQGLTGATAALAAKDAVSLLAQLVAAPHDPTVMWSLIRGLATASARLEAQEAAGLLGEALASTGGPYANGNVRVSLAQGLRGCS